MNFIKHLNAVFDHMDQNDALSSHHISLYLALFRQWNKNYFQNPISVVREDLMKAAHIGSANTYIKCIKQLDAFGYIQYIPSRNRSLGSLVNMYTFDNSREMHVRPSINYINKQNIKHTHSGETVNEQDPGSYSSTQFQVGDQGSDIPPPEEHVKIYFQNKGISPIEAEKFFNYYQSNGWLVGGKSKMKDWKAAARNWILNDKRINGRKNYTRPNPKNQGPLRLGPAEFNNDKDYNTPL